MLHPMWFHLLLDIIVDDLEDVVGSYKGFDWLKGFELYVKLCCLTRTYAKKTALFVECRDDPILFYDFIYIVSIFFIEVD